MTQKVIKLLINYRTNYNLLTHFSEYSNFVEQYVHPPHHKT